MKQLWMAATVVFITAPVWAQPEVAREDAANSDAISVGDLERAIGGRTTLELKFQDLTMEEVSAAVEKSSGLKFGIATRMPANGVMIDASSEVDDELLQMMSAQAKLPRWSADISKTDFWMALRQWNFDETERTKRERELLIGRRRNDRPPPAENEPVQISPDEAAMRSLDAHSSLSAFFNWPSGRWKLATHSGLNVGRLLDSWPCVFLLTDFQRNQKLSVLNTKAPEPPEKTEKEDKTEGGTLTDYLFLNLSVYLEPKLANRAKVSIQMKEALDENGENLLMQAGQNTSSASVYSSKIGMIEHSISLEPRQSKSRKLTTLRGVLSIRYPLQTQQHEFDNLSQAQTFLVNTSDVPVQAQWNPPQMRNGKLLSNTLVTIESSKGWRGLYNRYKNGRGRPFGEGPLGPSLLPRSYTFTDDQGGTWRSMLDSGYTSFQGPNNETVRQTSPPTPPPDNFVYIEKIFQGLSLVRPDSTKNTFASPFEKLPSNQLGNVRFTKVAFTTESDWRTLEVPFEFHDLPLPPR